jgi:hypothetical protein
LHQPATAAKTMLGQPASYDRLPYFFTDQYELGMEYTGYVEPGGYDQAVIRGDLVARKFIAFWLHHRRVLAGMNVNTWDVTQQITNLIRSGEPVDPTRLADPDIPLDGAAHKTDGRHDSRQAVRLRCCSRLPGSSRCTGWRPPTAAARTTARRRWPPPGTAITR